MSQIMRSGVLPAVMEIMDSNTVRVLREEGGMKLPEARALILVETDGFTQAEADYQMEVVADIFKANQAQAIQRAETQEQAEELWRARRAAGSTAARLAPNNASEDIVVPISQLPKVLREISLKVQKYGLPFVVFGHAGDGNLHPKFMYDANDPDQTARVKEAVQDIFALACSLNGSLSGGARHRAGKSPLHALGA